MRPDGSWRFRFLKGRSRAISLADYNVEKRLVRAVAHRMLLGDDEPAPISLMRLQVHAAASYHGRVRSKRIISVVALSG